MGNGKFESPEEALATSEVLKFRTKVTAAELLSNLVFEFCWSCGDLAGFGGFNAVFERDACDDFGEVVKAA